MDFDLTVPLSELLLLLWGDVLVPEEHDTPLRNQQTKLVFLLVREILELKTNNLRADVCSQVNDFFCCT